MSSEETKLPLNVAHLVLRLMLDFEGLLQLVFASKSAIKKSAPLSALRKLDLANNGNLMYCQALTRSDTHSKGPLERSASKHTVMPSHYLPNGIASSFVPPFEYAERKAKAVA